MNVRTGRWLRWAAAMVLVSGAVTFSLGAQPRRRDRVVGHSHVGSAEGLSPRKIPLNIY